MPEILPVPGYLGICSDAYQQAVELGTSAFSAGDMQTTYRAATVIMHTLCLRDDRGEPVLSGVGAQQIDLDYAPLSRQETEVLGIIAYYAIQAQNDRNPWTKRSADDMGSV